MSACYLDTSALAKWYVNEPGSDEFVGLVRDLDRAVVSRLTALELRCLLARRRRAGDFDQRYEARAFETFERDLAFGYLTLHAFADDDLLYAIDLVARLDKLRLRALDAMHLAIAKRADVGDLATADKIMAQAAERLGLKVHHFGAPE